MNAAAMIPSIGNVFGNVILTRLFLVMMDV
jgi:hypothetical protein